MILSAERDPRLVTVRRGGTLTDHDHRLLALWEGGRPTELDAELETIGLFDFAGALEGPMTAHPKVDPATGALCFFGANPFAPYLRYHEADASGALAPTRPTMRARCAGRARR